MLKFSRRIDYALVALSHITNGHDEKPISAKEIAETYRMPRPLLSNILKHLCRKGILTSVRGVRGGYRLQRPPSDVTLSDLIEALEGPVNLTICGSGRPVSTAECSLSRSCPVSVPIRRFQEKVGGLLKSVTLADISGRNAPKR